MVPLFGALVRVTYRRRRCSYPQPLYFALHLHAVAFAVLAVMAARRFGSTTLGIVIGAAAAVVLAQQRAYDVALLGALWRTLVLGLAYGLLLVAAAVAVVRPVFYR